MNNIEQRKTYSVPESIESKNINTKHEIAAKKTIRELFIMVKTIERFSKNYLSKEEELFPKNKIVELRREIVEEILKEEELKENKTNQNVITYDKYKKSFFLNQKHITVGEIVSFIKFDTDFSFHESALSSGEGKRLIRILKDKKISDKVSQKYGKEMSHILKEEFKDKDLLKSKAYEEIEKRSLENKNQFGIKAEQIFINLLESLSIDRPDLGFSVYEANPFQDVENKIDFIIERKNKRKGVGIEESKKENLKTIGIQFTTATSKREHKLDQISKAKNRIKGSEELDDIIYIEIDSEILRKAINDCERSNNKFTNPIKFLPESIKKQISENLFKEILSAEEIKSLEKNI